MQNGDKIVQLSVATQIGGKIKIQVSKEKELNGIVCDFNDALGKIAEQYLKRKYCIFRRSTSNKKWTDQQSGQEKYTTEVVLQRYRGELTLLGSRSENQISNDQQNDQIDQSNQVLCQMILHLI